MPDDTVREFIVQERDPDRAAQITPQLPIIQRVPFRGHVGNACVTRRFAFNGRLPHHMFQ